MRAEDRNRILREDVPRAQTPRERRALEGLSEDVRSSPLRGAPLRLRNFRSDTSTYFASLSGPRHYMLRLRAIEELTAAHERELGVRYGELMRLEPGSFARRWAEEAGQPRFEEVNALIARHNRWYPVEARLPMDPRRGDFALVNGRDYRLRPLDAAWVLERFPPLPRSRARTSDASVSVHSPEQSR